MGRKSELPLESRIEAVLAVLRKDEPMSIIARRYQVSEVTLSRWRDGFLEGGKAGIAGGGGGDGGAERHEMAKLRRELDEQKQIVGELTIANWVLKKTAARSP